MKRLLSFLFIFISVSHLHSQYANIWKLGNGYGLDFTTPTPVLIGSAISGHPDNSSSISDASGNLLFYTTGVNVWNKNNIIMPNGTGLIGSYTGGQCALIVPIPCSTTKYVIFHTTDFSNPGNLSYSVVDMSLNAGLGDVVVGQKNISLGTGWTEKICAYYNAANNCYWVLTHKWMSNQFVAWKVDATTIAVTSVTSSIGTVHNCGTVGGAHDAMGQLTISPDGTKVVNALTCQDKFEFFDFNQTSGVLSNSISIVGNGGNAWGTAFSPDSKKVYVNSIFGMSVFQYDLTTYTSPAILASKTTVYNTGVGGYNFGYMELGPNGKVYMPRPNTAFLSCVNSPNSLGAACNFSYSAISTGTATVQWGMSRIAYNIGPSSTGSLNLSSATTSITCNGLTNGSSTIYVANPGSYSYTWTPGGYTTASANNLAAGNYTVTVSDGGCNTNTTIVTILQPSAINLSISNPTTACKNVTTVLSSTVFGGNPSYTYTWLPGFSNTSSVSVNLNSSTVYTLLVRDSSLCTKTATTSISISTLTSNFNYNLNPCTGAITTTNTSVNSTFYNWDFGDGGTSNSVSPSHTYTNSGTYVISLIATNAAGCSDTITNSITVSNASQSIFTASTAVCDSAVHLTNSSIGAASYLWDFGGNITSTLSNPSSHSYPGSGTYTISLITNPGSSCADTSRQTVTIIKNVISQFSIGYSPCTTSISTANTSSFAVTYGWDFGDGFSSVSNNPSHNYATPGTYTVALIANPGTGCADTSYQQVTILGAPLASFTFVKDPCSAVVTFSNTSINSTSFQWDFGNGHTSNLNDPSFNFNHPGTYTVALTAQPGSGCSNTMLQTIAISYTAVTADFTYNNPQYTADAQFINQSQNALTFEWSFGDGMGSDEFEPFHTYAQMGDYTACLMATNIIGCSDVVCKNMKVDEDWSLYVPDVFTPNADGLNDLFFAKGTNITKFSMMIFDRWGEKIFSASDIFTGWDGKYKGKFVEEGVYTWKINFTDVYSKSHEKIGHVTVIK
jgi:gliding motility-associated-like protein